MSDPHIRLPNQVESPAVARAFVRRNSKLDGMRHTEVDLVVTELVSNVIRHNPEAEWIGVTVSPHSPVEVRVTVSNPAKAGIDGAEPGMGHLVVERFSRDWGTDFGEGILKVWFLVRTPGAISVSAEMSDSDLFDALDSDPALYSDALVRRHTDLASSIARRYRGKGIDDDDLEQVAHMALLKAIQRYDSAYGDIRPFAAVTISGELKKLLRDRGWSVRVPRSLQERSLEVSRASEELTQSLNREPETQEIAKNLDIQAAEVDAAMRAGMAYSTNSIEKPSPETGLSLLDRLERPDPGLLNTEDRVVIEAATQRLPARQRQILELRFQEDMTQSEIGEILQISQMHVSRLLSKALGALRADLDEDLEKA